MFIISASMSWVLLLGRNSTGSSALVRSEMVTSGSVSSRVGVRSCQRAAERVVRGKDWEHSLVWKARVSSRFFQILNLA